MGLFITHNTKAKIIQCKNRVWKIILWRNYSKTLPFKLSKFGKDEGELPLKGATESMNYGGKSEDTYYMESSEREKNINCGMACQKKRR